MVWSHVCMLMLSVCVLKMSFVLTTGIGDDDSSDDDFVLTISDDD